MFSLKKVFVAAIGEWRDGVWIWRDLGISENEVVEAGLPSKLAVL